MRLLICAQSVNLSDPTLGFFHTWVEAFAAHYESVTVFTLRAGDYVLPSNVTVIPLGDTRIIRILRLVRHSYKLRNQYDAVFVHMSQEFVLVAGWLWRYFRKKIYLWRNHYAGSVATDVAAGQCVKVFCTSKFSYTARFKHTVRMPVGVDTGHFIRLPKVLRDPRGVLFLGRITPSKRPHVLLQAFDLLVKKGVTFNAHLYGAQGLQDRSYISSLEKMIKEYGLADMVSLLPGVPMKHTPELFNRHTVFVNCSPSGMYDKTLFEAACCECAVVASSKDFAELVDQRFIFEDNNAGDLARKLEYILKLTVLEQQAIGAHMHDIAEQHSLSALMARLVEEMR